MILKPRRNDPCPCGSGKKYKKCCEAKSGEDTTVRKSPLKGLAPTPDECNGLVAMFNAGRYQELENWTRLLLERCPKSGFSWKVLGVTLQAQGKDALTALQKAAEFLPEDAQAHYNFGVALQHLGHHDRAVASYRRALEIKADYVEAHCNLGVALKELGHLDEAVTSYRRALEIIPDLATVHSNLGNALKDLGQLDDSVVSCLRALEINPDSAEAHNNLGITLMALGQLDNAVASYCRALEIDPDYAEAHNNLGITLRALGQLDNAVASYRRALEIRPDDTDTLISLGVALQDLGQLDNALTCFRRALEISPDFLKAYSNLLFLHNYKIAHPAATLLEEKRRYGNLAARQARPYTEWHNVAESEKCLRVGLVSGDLRNHPVGFFVEGVLAALASNYSGRLEFIAYPTHSCVDTLTERIKACCHGWHSAVGIPDENLARRIREDGIDILIDLSGHTALNRLPLFAWKPAPVQASWLGYFATTGVAAMDYLIADPWTVPESEDIYFTERVWRLPETRLCFTPPEVEIDVLPAPSLSNGCVTFGCFNNLTKINETVVALWAQVLQAVPRSRLFLKAKQLQEASERQRLLELFASHGIHGDQLLLEGSAPRADYLAAYQRVDIALDPFPFPGGTTSVECLWMGVPVLTLEGNSFLSRQGVGIMNNVGLPDWIAADTNDYLAKAIAHASDLPRLATLRSSLRDQVMASPLFDAPRFARHFEAALRGMWAQWCNQQQGEPSMCTMVSKNSSSFGR